MAEGASRGHGVISSSLALLLDVVDERLLFIWLLNRLERDASA